MEASSPLAAMHRPIMPSPAWAGRDLFCPPPPPPRCSTASGLAGSVSLREQLHKSTSDYFSLRDLRGSSPAASLAADLSQNFRLDNDLSPQFPTPRRALFTATVIGGMENRHYATTPPLPSSSPAPVAERMDVSPLPRRAPFCPGHELHSPTPLATFHGIDGSIEALEGDDDSNRHLGATEDDDEDGDDMVLDSPVPAHRPGSDSSRFMANERRLVAPRRPSLGRMKGLTTTALPGRSQAASQALPFRFGTASGAGGIAPPSPGECFDSGSPPRGCSPLSANAPYSMLTSTSRPRTLFSGLMGATGASGSGHRLGSPMSSHLKRPSNTSTRNRKQFRRSLSMFENPADVMKSKPEDSQSNKTSVLQSVMDIEEANELKLPHFLLDDPLDSIPRISSETLLEVLDGRYAKTFDQKMIIDCRFEYEYDGGHIQGAVNHNDKELLASQLFHTPIKGRTLLVFHCEYSAHRAPLMARHVRSEDRSINAEQYPKLTYPDVYILDGGYSGFFAEYRGRCHPQEYVEMSDEKHQRTCEREMGRLKARKGLGRAQTFAFGDKESCINDSPTGLSRAGSRFTSQAMLAQSPVPNDRSPARRMVSY